MRVLLKSAFNTATGYGNDGVGLAMALERAGCQVTLSPVNVMPPIPHEVAFMLTRPPEPPFDLMINHTDPAQISISPGERRVSHRAIAWSMWEYPSFGGRFEDLPQRLEHFDDVFAYDETSAEAFAGTHPNVKTLQGGYDPEPWKPVERDWTKPIRFGCWGVLGLRKNPWATLEAFEEVHKDFPEAQLYLKTNDRTLPPQIMERYKGVTVWYDFWNLKKQVAFAQSLHCYVSSSRGEGKNLPAIESGTTGAALILSSCGGHKQWASSEYARMVKGEFTTFPTEPSLTAFQVDHEDLVSAMREVCECPAWARQLGDQAARQLPSMLSWDSVVYRLLSLSSAEADTQGMSALSVPASTELRCPSGARKLLAKVRTEGGVARRTDGNLLELSCRDCTQRGRKAARATGDPEPTRVLHRFDLAGFLVETAVIQLSESGETQEIVSTHETD